VVVFGVVFVSIAVSLSSFVAHLYCRVCGVCSAVWHVVQLFCLFDTSWGRCAGRVREQLSHLTSVLFRTRLRLHSLAVQASRHFPFRNKQNNCTTCQTALQTLTYPGRCQLKITLLAHCQLRYLRWQLSSSTGRIPQLAHDTQPLQPPTAQSNVPLPLTLPLTLTPPSPPSHP